MTFEQWAFGAALYAQQSLGVAFAILHARGLREGHWARRAVAAVSVGAWSTLALQGFAHWVIRQLAVY